MEMVVSLFAAAGTAAAAGGATAAASAGLAGAAGGAAAAAASGASVLGVLQGVVTAGSILSSVVGGFAQSSQLKTQARMAEIEGQGQALASEQRALEIRKKALQTQASNAVAFSASGVDAQSGASAALNDGIATDAAYSASMEKLNAEKNLAAANLKASAYRSQADGAITSGILNGLVSGAKYGLSSMNRT